MFAHGVGGAGDEYRRDMLNMIYGTFALLFKDSSFNEDFL